MNNKHVTSLELSKKLKELGVPQKSEFYWYYNSDNDKYWVERGERPFAVASAFLASELGEMLPIQFDIKKGSKWVSRYWWGEHPNPLRQESKTMWHSESHESLPESMGLMLVYLKEKGLV